MTITRAHPWAVSADADVQALLPGSVGTSLLALISRNPTAVAGGNMQVDHNISETPSLPVSLGGIWPDGQTRAWVAITKVFDNTITASIESPQMTLFTIADQGTAGYMTPVVSHMCMANAKGANGSAFGSNIVVRNYAGDTLSKMVGLEIDIEPTAGTTALLGAAMYANAFSISSGLGPVLQVGGVGGGAFDNGIRFSGIAASGTCIGAESTLACQSLIDTSNGTYSSAAINLGTNHQINSAAGQSIYGDSGGGWHVTTSSGLFVDRADTSTEGAFSAAFRSAAPGATVQMFLASGTGWNGSACAMTVAKNTTTSRSLNLAGTANAAGADYAEYEVRRPDAPVFAKGDIVGFDADGLLTCKYSEALGVGVKSTNPNLCGGDTWAIELGERPLEPMFDIPADITRPVEPARYRAMTDADRAARAVTVADLRARAQVEAKPSLNDIANVIEGREYAKLSRDEQIAAMDAYDAAMVEYAASVAAARSAWLAGPHAAWIAAAATWDAALEVARARVDRIAYCGKVPVNGVTGAAPGDVILATAGPNDTIVARVVKRADATADDRCRALGVVRRILPDGRPEIVVNPLAA